MILRSIKRFAEASVRGMKEEARERSLDLNSFETYPLVRDMPANGWEKDPNNQSKITACPMESVWAEYGEEGLNLGSLYCTIDHVLFDGFNADLERPYWRTSGDDCCDFHPKARR